MSVSTESKFRAEHDGKQYYFCSNSCHQKFLEEPAKYVGVLTSDAAGLPLPVVEPEGTIYTCPMHPRFVGTVQVTARSAGWPWSRYCPISKTAKVRS
ncbi:YHS domain-containing protein [Cupriavidus pauculus]|uniref:YHS domain-containing protein n=1 Tax=Cupriavidus pauculus TaxID=82633 RepID=UPI0021D968E7|nr:YHS domain-containing protein [Cupriavidus pauculus]